MIERFGSLKYALNGVYSGGTPTAGDESFYSDEGYPFVTIGDMSTQMPIERTKRHLSEAGRISKNLRPVKANTVILSMYATIGLPNILAIDACISQAIIALFPRKEHCQRFIFWWLMHYRRRLEADVAGSTQGNLNAERVKNIRFRFVELSHQRQIADFLDRETARIDLLIEKKQQFLDLASERWHAALNHHIFPNAPNWQHLPTNWRRVRLKYLTDERRPIMYGIVLPGPNMEVGPMIVKGGDVKPGRLDPEKLCRTTVEIEASYERSRLKSGDLVISIRGGIGDIEVVPPTIEGANLTQDAARIAPRTGVNVDWLRYALQSSAVFHPLESKSLGAAVRGINIFDLKRVYLPTPPLAEQTKIASSLRIHEQRLDDLKTRVIVHADRLREYRAALITAAVTGQIDVMIYTKAGRTDRRLDEIQEEMGA